MNETKLLVSVNEAAQALGVSREYLYRLPPGTPGLHRFGRAIRIQIDELKEWGRRAMETQRHDR